MSKLPNPPTKDTPIDASWARDLIDFIREHTITAFTGGKLRRSPLGTTIDASLDADRYNSTHRPWLLRSYTSPTASLKLSIGKVYVQKAEQVEDTSGSGASTAAPMTKVTIEELDPNPEITAPHTLEPPTSTKTLVLTVDHPTEPTEYNIEWLEDVEIEENGITVIAHLAKVTVTNGKLSIESIAYGAITYAIPNIINASDGGGSSNTIRLPGPVMWEKPVSGSEAPTIYQQYIEINLATGTISNSIATDANEGIIGGKRTINAPDSHKSLHP